MAKRLNKNLVIGLASAGFVVTTVAGVLMVHSLRETDPEEFVARAKDFAAAKDWQSASTYYRRAYAVDKNPVHLVRAGDMSYQIGDERGALGLYSAAVDVNPALLDAQEKLLDIRLEYANMFGIRTESWENVRESADAILALEGQSEHPRALYARGKALLQLKQQADGNEAEGLRYLRKAVEVAPNDLESVKALADYLRAKGQTAESEKLLAELVTSNTESGEAAAKSRCYLANLRTAQGKSAEAEELLHDALSLVGDDEALRGAVLTETGRYWLEQFRSLHSDGTAEDDANKAHDETQSVLTKAIEADPENVLAYLALAELHRLNGDIDQAIKTCQERLDGDWSRRGLDAIRTRASRHKLLLSIANLRLAQALDESAGSDARLAKCKEADQAVDDALAEIADEPQAVHTRGRIRYVEGRNLEAIHEFEQAKVLSRIPDPVNLELLAQARFQQGVLGAAREAVVEALSQPGARPSAWILHANILLRLNDPQGALTAIEQLLSVDPGNRDAILVKAAALEQLGQESSISELLKTDDRSAVVATRCVRRAEGGDPQGALDELLPFLRERPTVPRLVSAAVAIYKKLDRGDDAKRVLDEAITAVADPFQFKIMKLNLEDLDAAEKEKRVLALIEETPDAFLKAIRLANFFSSQGDDKIHDEYEQYKTAKKLIMDRSTEAARRAGENGLRVIFDRLFELARALDDETGLDELVAEAARYNDGHGLDAAEGLSYRGRRLILKGLKLRRQAIKAAGSGEAEDGRTLSAEAHRQFSDAIDVLHQALKLNESSGLTLAALGDANLYSNRLNEALIAYERCDEVMPRVGQVVRQIAVVASMLGNMDEYRERVAQCRQLFPDDPWIKEQLLIFDEDAKPQEAIATRERIRENEPDNEINLQRLVKLYHSVGNQNMAAQRVDDLLAVSTSLGNLAFADAELLDIGMADKAIGILQEALRTADDETKPNLMLLIGRHYRESQRFQDAEDAYLRSIDADPNERAFMETAKFYFAYGQQANDPTKFELASAQLERAFSLADAANSPALPLIYRMRIETMLRRDKKDEARTLCDEYLSRFPDDANGIFLDAQVSERFGDIREAIGKLDRYIEKQPTDEKGRFLRAEYLSMLGDWQSAIDELEELRATDPDALDFAPRRLLARAYSRVDRKDLAVQEMENVLEQHPEARAVAEELVDVLTRRDRLADADAVVTGMLNRSPNDPRWLVKGAELALQQAQEATANHDRAAAQGHRTQAITELRKAAALTGFASDVTTKLLAVYKSAGAIEDGIAYFEREIPSDRISPSNLTVYGSLLVDRGDIDEALDTFRYALHQTEFESIDFVRQLTLTVRNSLAPPQHAIELFRDQSGDEWFQRANKHILGALLQANSAYAESDAIVEELLKHTGTEKERANLLLRLANSYEQQERYKEACDLYKQVLAIDGRSILALNNLAYILSDKLNDPTQAIPYGKQAAVLITEGPGAAAILDTLGWAYLQAGQFEEAVARLIHGRREDPYYLPVTYHLAEAYRRLKKFDEAQNLFREVLESDATGDEQYKEYAQLARQSLEKAENRISD